MAWRGHDLRSPARGQANLDIEIQWIKIKLSTKRIMTKNYRLEEAIAVRGFNSMVHSPLRGGDQRQNRPDIVPISNSTKYDKKVCSKKGERSEN